MAFTWRSFLHKNYVKKIEFYVFFFPFKMCFFVVFLSFFDVLDIGLCGAICHDAALHNSEQFGEIRLVPWFSMVKNGTASRLLSASVQHNSGYFGNHISKQNEISSLVPRCFDLKVH